jgi:hypothetical protein
MATTIAAAALIILPMLVSFLRPTFALGADAIKAAVVAVA